jgi:hypothetical protein
VTRPGRPWPAVATLSFAAAAALDATATLWCFVMESIPIGAPQAAIPTRQRIARRGRKKGPMAIKPSVQLLRISEQVRGRNTCVRDIGMITGE